MTSTFYLVCLAAVVAVAVASTDGAVSDLKLSAMQTKSAHCGICTKIVGAVEAVIDKGEPVIKATAKGVCTKLNFIEKAACKIVIDVSLGLIVKEMKAHPGGAKDVCSAVDLC